MLLKLAWKNIWRNKLRSSVILTAIAVGMVAATFSVAFANGMVSKKINDVIEVEMNHISIATREFVEEMEVDDCFDATLLLEEASRMKEVVGVSPRVVVNASVATAHKMGGVRVVGVNPVLEKRVSRLYQYVGDSLGKYLAYEQRMPVVVGKSMAEKYRLKVGSKLVVSVADVMGEQQSAAFRVCGVFHTPNPTFEEAQLFVLDRDLRELIHLPTEQFHEVGVQLIGSDDNSVSAVMQRIAPLLPEEVEPRTWKQINALVAIYTDYFGYIIYMVVGIILFALGFGIVNTVLMSVVERQKEFMMLLSIGMKRAKVMWLVIAEGTLLTSIGGAVGMLIGALLVATNHEGIDMSAAMGNFAFAGIDSQIVPTIGVSQFFIISIMIIITGIISSIYPAKTATKWRK